MYALGEDLDYPALKVAAHAKLVDLLITKRGRLPYALKDLIDATFAPPNTVARICDDASGSLQNLAVAAVIAHEANDWSGDETYRTQFTESLQAPEYAAFWDAYKLVKEENVDLLQKAERARERAEKMAKAAEERQVAAKLAEGAAGAKGGVGGSGSLLGAQGVSKKRRYRQREVDRARMRGKKAVGDGQGGGDVEMEVD
tara:strand:- start:89 stop:688 length:600 start_codon:yes stop_codon:yes gene_type:complete